MRAPRLAHGREVGGQLGEAWEVAEDLEHAAREVPARAGSRAVREVEQEDLHRDFAADREEEDAHRFAGRAAAAGTWRSWSPPS